MSRPKLKQGARTFYLTPKPLGSTGFSEEKDWNLEFSGTLRETSLSPGTFAILDWMTDCRIPSYAFSSIPDVYTPDASITMPSLWQAKITVDIATCPCEKENQSN